MKFQDISVRKRILIANILMVCIPVFLLISTICLLVANIKHSSATRQKLIELMSSEKTSMLSVQYTISDLCEKIEKGKKIEKLIKSCRLLEEQGIKTAIKKDTKVVYISEGLEIDKLERDIEKKMETSEIGQIWDEDGFMFIYKSQRGITVLAFGDIVFWNDEAENKQNKRIIEIILYGALSVAVTIIALLGWHLSRLLSQQILKPIDALRSAAEEIKRGNLDSALNINARDELGEACQDFEKMRVELKNARDLKIRYEENRKELMAGITHDLSTPLTALKGYISGLNDGIANTEQKRKHYLEMMQETTNNMTKLVDSLFLFSKLDMGRVEFHRQPVAIYDYFLDFVQEKKSTYRERGLLLELKGEKSNAKVDIDYVQFARVVDNLLENSLKYRRGDAVKVIIDLKFSANYAIISFGDDGVGVEKEHLPKLFDSFYRTDRARTNVGKGSGLGLAIVKQIISGLGGTVKAESSPGGGLAIVIKLPIKI